MLTGTLPNYEVLAKPDSSPFTLGWQSVGSPAGDSLKSEGRLVFGELRPVDGGTPIFLEKPSITFGQDRASDVVIEHPSVSASHCHMEFREGHWFIEDLGSRDGIRVNGERVESAWVPAQSVLNIGAIEYDLQYSSQDGAADGNGAVTDLQRSKLDSALKLVQAFKNRRLQVRSDTPTQAPLPKNRLGLLLPMNGGHPIPLLYDELYLGRDPDSDVILPFLSVAKTHCVLRFQEGYWLVRDLNNNGVTIDGQSTAEGWLLPGTVLGLGGKQFSVEYSTTADAPPPETVVPINEFDVQNDDPVTDDDSEVVDLDESAIIDSDDELEVDHSPLGNHDPRDVSDTTSTTVEASADLAAPQPVLDVPLQHIEEMLRAFENDQSPSGSRVSSPETPIDRGSTPENTQAPEPRVNMAPKRSESKPASVNRHRQRDEATPRAQPIPAPVDSANSKPTPSRLEFARSRQQQVQQFLKDHNFDGLLLTQPSNIAWYTGGAEPPRGLLGQVTAALLLTPDLVTLLARRSDTEVMLGSETSLVGLQHHICEWPENSAELLKDWSQPKRLAVDGRLDVGDDVSPELDALRLPLHAFEIETLRKLGIRVARAIEKGAREVRRGDTEAQIAGDIASRLVRHDVIPERIQVWGDGRGQACPNWTFRRDAVEHFFTISVIGRRQGLHVAVSRTVSFGTAPKELRWTHSDMLLAHATAMHALRDQAEVSMVVARVREASEKLGFVPDWSATLPGCVTGYASCEAPLSMQSTFHLRSGMPLIWQSSLGPARAVDTLLVRKADGKVITQTGEWPQVSLSIDGVRLFGQAVLQRSL